jgi:immune inhibitor A
VATQPFRRTASVFASTALAAVLAVALGGPPAVAAPATPSSAKVDAAAAASNFLFYKYPAGQPVSSATCNGSGLNVSSAPDYSRDDCGFTVFQVSGEAKTVKAALYGAGPGQPFATVDATPRSTAAGEYSVALTPTDDWPAGAIRMVVLADDKPAGETTFGHNRLVATLSAAENGYQPGEEVTVEGTIAEADSTTNAPQTRPVAASLALELEKPDGTSQPVPGPRVTADDNGVFTATIPGSMTEDIEAGPETDYTVTLRVAAVDATYDDPSTGAWAADEAGGGPLVLTTPPDTLQLENSFVSAVGWVKPGETYPSRVFVRNPTDQTFNDVSVAVSAAEGSTFTQVSGGGTIADGGSMVDWAVGSVAPGTTKTLVLESQSDTTEQDPEIVWKDLSSTAVLSVSGAQESTQLSHGPKVIPQATTYDTARYGDRPFPVVPVDYRDRKHQETNSGDELSAKINSTSVPGSTYNLFQEMSLGQLFPEGTIPSAGIGTADFGDEEYDFTTPQPQGTCKGVTLAEANGTPLNPERIKDGFYQLPGDTEYYGGDRYGSAVAGSAGVAPLFDIDSACGPTGKLVYDAATIADPEIDYSDYDTDKDGVVDFFMVVFAGCGGNGASQLGPLGCAYDNVPYDNIWPHSSSLEFYYTDGDTGQTGYISNDQLKDLEGRPLYYTKADRSEMTTTKTDFPVFVRVGPYNVNPETAIDKASVISHEYGHSLGLPDFYSASPRETYGDWNLMATDKSQHMDIFGRQEMGWVVPEVLEPGKKQVDGWKDSKTDTGEITWQTPDGDPYTLVDGEDGIVHNSEAYVAKLPGRQLIDPAKFDTGDKASKTHAWWSGSGNDFGCSPDGGHNLDVVVPGVENLPEGTTIELEFKSLWDIEWDYDYGFVLTSTPTEAGEPGAEYTSNESENGYTTPATQNPNGNSCQLKYGNGITGSSGSYDSGTAPVDRVTGDSPESVFLADRYDVSELAGQDLGVVRFSYATDPGLARPGWFIDDIKVTATLPDGTTKELLATDLEDDAEGGPGSTSFYSGGCKDDTRVAQTCTPGWNYIASDAEAPADHAYYMELRDRSGFDRDGNGEIDRDPIAFLPGLSLVYTDEAHGYGNTGGGNPPAQSPLDSQPQPGNDAPDLSDAAWTAAAGDKLFSDAGKGHVDNYTDPEETQAAGEVANPWRFDFNCLSFVVDQMSGTDTGPANPVPGNLVGDVTFDIGDGCGEFDYGHVSEGGGTDPGNGEPTAVIKVKRKAVHLGQKHHLDGSASTDAETPDDLDYSWDLGDGGVTKDAVGPRVKHEFADPGVYKVRLTVTDPRGKTDTATKTIRVFKNLQCAQRKVTKTGGWKSRHGSAGQFNHHCDNAPDGTAGDTMSLDFQGPRIGLKWGRAKQGGTARVLVDGERIGQVSFKGRSAEPRFDGLRIFTGLGGGRHTITLVVAPPDGKRRLAYVDYFRVYGSAYRTR